MKKRHKRALALMAAKKAGDLVLGRAAARNAPKRGQPEPPRQCPYAKAAKMALAGVESKIPVDECVLAMRQVGDMLPCSLKETSQAGLAATPTGIRLKKQVFGEN